MKRKRALEADGADSGEAESQSKCAEQSRGYKPLGVVADVPREDDPDAGREAFRKACRMEQVEKELKASNGPYFGNGHA